MMSEIKQILAESEEFNKNFCPEDIYNFNFLLRVMIGPKGEQGEESFDVEVYTTKWIEDNLDDNDVMIGRHKIIMKEYNYKILNDKVIKLFESKSGDNWKEIAEQLSKYAYWEFEDYKE
ncbi:MAG: hypothetical protein BM556_08110 [Bacteriovorax sp. MedPE-SWde]|nr:MAG: hypothetical protein BM556_08110 [Bacteriovorax sp. MedPE-SWde]